MAGKLTAIFCLLALLAGGCSTVTVPTDYPSSDVWVGSRSTCREALELAQHAIWEGRNDIARSILSEKTKAELGQLGRLAFWYILGEYYAPIQLDTNIPSDAWITVEEFMKYAKTGFCYPRTKFRMDCMVEIEFGEGRYSRTDPIIMILERDGWAVGLIEMREEWGG